MLDGFNKTDSFEPRLYVIGFISGAFLALLAICLSDTINPDGVKFIEAAKAFLENGIAGAFSYYRWPFYSILIGIVSQISGLSLLNTAYLINICASGLIGSAFIAASMEIRRSRKNGWIALIVVSTLPGINEYRDYIFRDILFWSLFTLSLYLLLRFSRTNAVSDGLLWQAVMGSTLFLRTEGIIFIFLAPSVIFFQTGWNKKSLIKTFKLTSLLWIGTVVTLAYLSVTINTASMSRIGEIAKYLDFSEHLKFFNTKVGLMQDHVLPVFSADDASFILVIGLVGFVFWQFISHMGLFFPVILIYGTFCRGIRENSAQRLVLILLAISISILLFFILQRFYLPGRYTVLSQIVAGLAMVSYLAHLIEKQKIKHGMTLVLVILFIFSALDPFISTGTNKNNIKEAGAWFSENHRLRSSLLSNNSLLYFYSGRKAYESESEAIANRFETNLRELLSYDFVMIRDQSPTKYLDIINHVESGKLTLVKEFPDPDHKYFVSVFEVNR